MIRGKRILSFWLLALMALALTVAPRSAQAATAFAWGDYHTVTVGDTGMMEPGLDFTSGRVGAYSSYNDLEVEQNLPDIYLTSPAGALMDLGEVELDEVPPLDGTWVKKLPAVAGHVYLYARGLNVVKFQVVRVVAGQLKYSLPAVTITYAGGKLTGSDKLQNAKDVKLTPACSSKLGTDSPSCLKISLKDSEVSLTWKAPTAAPADGYHVYRSLTGEDGSWDLLSDFPVKGTAFVDYSAVPGVTYYYAVVAIGGNESQVVKVTVPKAVLPDSAEALTVEFTPGSRFAWINGQRFVLDVAPQWNGDGYFLVPVRFLAEALGGEVLFNASTGKFGVALGDSVYIFQLGKKTALVNDEAVDLDTAPVLIDNRAMIPIGFVDKYMGLDLSYDEDTDILSITRDLARKEPAPAPAPSPAPSPAPDPTPAPAKPSRADYAFVPGKYALSTGGPVSLATGSWLQLNADGTYVWDSKWDGEVIHGTWEPFNTSSIILYDGQEGRDWLVDRTVASQRTSAEINVYNDFTQYLGTKM